MCACRYRKFIGNEWMNILENQFEKLTFGSFFIYVSLFTAISFSMFYVIKFSSFMLIHYESAEYAELFHHLSTLSSSFSDLKSTLTLVIFSWYHYGYRHKIVIHYLIAHISFTKIRCYGLNNCNKNIINIKITTDWIYAQACKQQIVP